MNLNSSGSVLEKQYHRTLAGTSSMRQSASRSKPSDKNTKNKQIHISRLRIHSGRSLSRSHERTQEGSVSVAASSSNNDILSPNRKNT